MIAIMLIHSDRGRPDPRGGLLHYVVLAGDGVTPVAEAQMGMGGRWPYYDCGVAVVTSVARTLGHPAPSPRDLETDEGNQGQGASIAGILRGLTACGLSGRAEHFTPPRSIVMNPAWGGIIAAADSQPYLDAAAVGWGDGWTIVIDTPTNDQEVSDMIVINTGLGMYVVAPNGAYGPINSWTGPTATMEPERFNAFIRALTGH